MSTPEMDRGSVALFVAAIVLPLLFFAMSLSLDLGKYYRESQDIQKTIDEAAQNAYQFLPYTTAAQAAAESYMAKIAKFSGSTTISVDPDSVTLQYSGISSLNVASYFGVNVDIPVTAYTKIRGSPVDALVLMDNGAHLAPAVGASATWGNLDEWPAAYFFQFEKQLAPNGVPVDTRIVTQQCFNPGLSALKMATIDAYAYLQRFNLNAVGLAFYPGAGGPVDIARNIGPGGIRPISGDTGEADFRNYETLIASNAYCAAAAEREVYWDYYKFPQVAPGTELDLINKPQFMITPVVWTLNPDYVSVMSAREVIWSRAAHADSNGSTAEALRFVRAQLIGAPNMSIRGGLRNKAIKTALLFAGDVPREGSYRFPDSPVPALVQEQLSGIRSDVQDFDLAFRLYYILPITEGNNDPSLPDRLAALRAFLSDLSRIEGSPVPGFEIKLLVGATPETISQELGSFLTTERRTSLISR